MNHHRNLSEWHEVPARFTADEFMQVVVHPPFTHWVGKVELVEGVIVRTSPAYIPHWNAQRIVAGLIGEVFERHSSDWIVGQEPTVRLSETTVREPDVAVLRTRELIGDIFEAGALFLAVEIADSSLTIDLNDKRHDYASAGIPHYWVVDINARQVHVMTAPNDGDYLHRRVIAFGASIAVPGTDRTIVLD